MGFEPTNTEVAAPPLKPGLGKDAWSGIPDLNWYDFNHTPLKRARLPIPPIPDFGLTDGTRTRNHEGHNFAGCQLPLCQHIGERGGTRIHKHLGTSF